MLPDNFRFINFLAPGPPSDSFGTSFGLEGAPGAIFVIKAILLGTKNYGDIGDKKIKNSKKLLIKLFCQNRPTLGGSNSKKSTLTHLFYSCPIIAKVNVTPSQNLKKIAIGQPWANWPSKRAKKIENWLPRPKVGPKSKVFGWYPARVWGYIKTYQSLGPGGFRGLSGPIPNFTS